MARQSNTLFLEQWLRTNVGGINQTVSGHSSSSSSSARAIIQAWSELRDSLQNQTFHPHILQSLKTLLNSQASLHVADPQAKLLLSVLSSQSFDLPSESYPILLRLLYIWVRKSVRPSAALIDSAVDVISRIFATEWLLEEDYQLVIRRRLSRMCWLGSDMHYSSVDVLLVRVLDSFWEFGERKMGLQTLGTSEVSYVPFALVMVAAGVLRASRNTANGQGLEFVSILRISAERQIAFVAQLDF
ncbi:hypothetical protein F3Y22_tig00110933pilonHSYRG00099 [Hibiscus syriacus]|uniref:Uncharacterized protein n=1 Tax=Hibiscus syriacus TaxID=106335 RepID=A0A6A2ZCV8_HIBSY|nr:hypothetical protein F3Y22_tig00110933pilonHSYRG00099 [Hibiscus syriacus]